MIKFFLLSDLKDKKFYKGHYTSPIGRITLSMYNDILVSLEFNSEKSLISDKHSDAYIQKVGDAIFNHAPLSISFQGTPLQEAVWHTLLTIPAGELRSYEQVAYAIDKPRAVRAVANAIGANPLPYIIPCHRVIRKNGTIGGFTGGLPIKRKLLAAEGIAIDAL